MLILLRTVALLGLQQVSLVIKLRYLVFIINSNTVLGFNTYFNKRFPFYNERLSWVMYGRCRCLVIEYAKRERVNLNHKICITH